MSAVFDWSGRVAFGPCWMLFSGALEVSELAKQRATKIIVHAGNPCVYVDNAAVAGPVALIPPARQHEVRSKREHALIICLEPTSRIGKHITTAQRADVHLAGHPVTQILGALRPASWAHAEEAVHRVVSLLAPADGEPHMGWWRHPSIDEALLIPANRHAQASNEAWLERSSGVSVSHLSNVLDAEYGVDLRTYVRWLRLSRAARVLGGETDVHARLEAPGYSTLARCEIAFGAMFGVGLVHAAVNSQVIS
jgi:AraC-like DNA-binding protein